MRKSDYYVARRIGCVVAIATLLGLLVLLGVDKKEKREEANRLGQISAEMRKERIEKEKERAELEAKDSFYQKLADGFDVNMLVVGDSIGATTGSSSRENAWVTLLEKALENTFGIDCKVTNVSMGGNASYAGYVRTMCLGADEDYDLAIICYGQNDNVNQFGMYYEAMIRAIRNNNEKCSIISILESSQRDYTEKMITIQQIAEHYGILVADTIKPFIDGSEGDYYELTNDGVHPNDKGQEVYAKVVGDVIMEAAKKYLGYDNAEIDTIFEGVSKFDNFMWIDVSDFEKRGNEYIYTVGSPISGIAGIDYVFVPGENSCEIIIDGEAFAAPEVVFNYDFSQRHIMILGEGVTTAREFINVKFANEEQASEFKGICFSWK